MTLYEELCWRQAKLWVEQAHKRKTQEGMEACYMEAVVAFLEACFS